MNKYLSILYTGVFVMLATNSFSQNALASSFIKANELMQAKDYTGAIDNLTKAISLGKNNKNKLLMAILYDKRAICKTELKLYKEAVADEMQATAANPSYSFAYWNRGLAYSRMGEYEAGIKDYTRAIPYFKGNTGSLYILYDNRGLNNTSLKQYDKAIDDFTQAINQHVQQGGAYWHRGIAYGLAKKYQLAVDDYTTAMFYFPDNLAQLAILYDNRGVNKKSLKLYRESLNDFNTAIKLNPANPNFYWHRGFTYQTNGDYQLAINDYTTAIPYYQGDNEHQALLYENLATNEMRLRQSQKAMDDISKAINLNPGKGNAYFTRGSFYSQLGENKLAIEDYDKAATFFKDSGALAVIHGEKASCLYILNENQQVVDECTTAITLNPGYTSFYHTRGRTYLKMGNKDKATSDFNKVIQLDTTKSVSYIFAQFYTGHQDLALQLLQQQVLITPNPDDVLTHYYNIACVFSIINKPDEANAYLKKAIDAGYSKKFAANDEDFNNIRKTTDYVTTIGGVTAEK